MRGKPGKVLHKCIYGSSFDIFKFIPFSFFNKQNKKSQYALTGLIFDRFAFSNAKIFYSNFVNKFPNFSDCLGNFICLHSDIMWDYMNRCYFSVGCDV